MDCNASPPPPPTEGAQTARELLADYAGVAADTMQGEDVEGVIALCKDLPLALSICGAIHSTFAEVGGGWADVLDAISPDHRQIIYPEDWTADKKIIDSDRNESVLHIIAASVDRLPEGLKESYLAIAIFPENAWIPETVLSLLWGDETTAQTRLKIKGLSNRNMLQCDADFRVHLHDLQREQLHMRVPVASGDGSEEDSESQGRRAQHGRLLEAFAQRYKNMEDNVLYVRVSKLADCDEEDSPSSAVAYFRYYLEYHIMQAGSSIRGFCEAVSGLVCAECYIERWDDMLRFATGWKTLHIQQEHNYCLTIGNIIDFRSWSNLTDLDLSSTGVTGDILVLSMLVNLSSINLSGTGVLGDVSALSTLANLRSVCLFSTSVSGDISGLGTLTNLVYLSLCHCANVGGDITGLTALTSLADLHLAHTDVVGDISQLRSLAKLTDITLEGTRVTGDIGELGALTNLDYVDVSNTRIAGDISGLRKLANLTELVLENTGVTGDISRLNVLTNLSHIDLSDTYVTGDLSGLGAVTNLTHLDLYGACFVTGDVSELATLRNLDYLRLSRTRVTGDISKLSALTKLKDLHLDYTAVNGNLSGLSALTNLENIALSESGVTGDISSLGALINLSELFLESVDVTGDVSELSAMSRLSGVNLGGTRVTGKFSAQRTSEV